nr:hypothetical protein [Pandoravirus massiliensis]
MDAYYAVVAALPSAVLCPPIEQATLCESHASPLLVAGLCGCATLAGLWALARRRRTRRRIRHPEHAEKSTTALSTCAPPVVPIDTTRQEFQSDATTAARSCDAQKDHALVESRAVGSPSGAARFEPIVTGDDLCGASAAADEPLATANKTDLNPRLLMMLARDVSVHASWAPAYDDDDDDDDEPDT